MPFLGPYILEDLGGSNLKNLYLEKVDFDQESPSPLNLGDFLQPGTIVVAAFLNITEAFDDTDASATIGTADQPDIFLDDSEGDLATDGIYEKQVFDFIETVSQAKLFLDLGTSTVGKGTAYLLLREN